MRVLSVLKSFFCLIAAVATLVLLQSCSTEKAEKHLREGKELFAAKNFKDAAQKFTFVIDNADGDLQAQAYYQRALAKEQLGDTQGAVGDYSEALQISENDYESWHNRGILKDNLGDHKGAINDYSRAIGIDAGRYEAFLNRGVAYSNLSQKQEAMRDFENALRRNPAFARGWYFLALTKHDLRDTTACRDAQNAVKLGLPEADKFLKEHCEKF